MTCNMVCVSIGEPNVQSILHVLKDKSIDFAEIRIDKIKDPTKEQIKRIFSSHQNLIATCRLCGSTAMTNVKRFDLLKTAIESGAAYIDIELESINEKIKERMYGEKLIGKARKNGCEIIISYHNYQCTPSLKELEQIIQHGFEKGAGVVKIACMVNSENDCRILMDLLKSYQKKLIVIPMGEQGKLLRAILSLKGSLFTFASLVHGKETGPGQMTKQEIEELQKGYLSTQANSEPTPTKLFGVFGNSILHSRSPQMYNAAFKYLNFNGSYVRLIATNGKDIVESAQTLDLAGFNVTAPYKEDVMNCLDTISKEAKEIGSVNTVITVIKKDNGELEGHNTDHIGVRRSLEEAGIKLSQAKIILLGAGGAAKAAAYALKGMNVGEVVIANRTVDKAAQLAKKYGFRYCGISKQELSKELRDASGILSTISAVDTQGGINDRINYRIIEPEDLRKDLFILDANYKTKTKLVADGESKGCKIIDGKEWLLHQGVAAFELFTGKRAPLEVMRRALTQGKRHHKSNQRRSNIALIGMMGSGKSSIAKFISGHSALNFLDLDQEIEREAKRRIKEIFELFGEAEFRKMEKNAVRKIRKIKNTAIACGGGIVLDKENMTCLRKYAMVVWFYAGVGQSLDNIRNDKNRPLMGFPEKEREKIFSRILKSRILLYSENCDLAIVTSNKNLEAVARMILDEIGVAWKD